MGAEPLAVGIAQGIEGQGKCQGVAKDGLEIDVCSRHLIGLVGHLVAGLDEELTELERDVERHRARTASTVRTGGALQATGNEDSFDDALSAQLRLDRAVAETRQPHSGIGHRRCHDDVPAPAGLTEDVGDRED